MFGAEFAVGIDLGTTNTVVAYARDGQLDIVRDSDGHFLHPSVVAFKPSGERLVGLKARLRRLIDPANTIFSAKRIIGQPFQTSSVQRAIARLPYKVEAGDNFEPVVVTRSGRLSVIEVSSYLLEYVKEVTEAHLGHPVTHCVITVPANFSDGQRAATRLAAEWAGFQVLRILNEPTAAALAYGLGRELKQKVTVFDMGGGTFDATVLDIHDNMFEVQATGGDPYLGGDDMDEELGKILARQFLETHRIDIIHHRHAVAKTIIAAEQIKMKLSEDEMAEGSISELDFGEGGVPLGIDFRITRAQFEQVVGHIVGRAIQTTEKVLSDAQLTPQLVDEVLLVGGSTRVPLVQRRVQALFGTTPRGDVDPMLAVALGAAIQAEMLLGPPASVAQVPLLMDVTGHGLGVAMAGKYVDQIIAKNTPIPADRSRVFATSRDNQTEVDIKVCQGEAQMFEENHPLGVVRLDGLRPAPRGDIRIEVSFLLDANGMLKVTARDIETGNMQQANLNVHGVDVGARVGDA